MDGKLIYLHFLSLSLSLYKVCFQNFGCRSFSHLFLERRPGHVVASPTAGMAGTGIRQKGHIGSTTTV